MRLTRLHRRNADSSRAAASAATALCAAGLLAGAPAAAVAEHTPTHTPGPDCLRSGRTVAANEHARVFYVGRPASHVKYFCLLRNRRVRTLGDYQGAFGGVSLVVLSGQRVAFELFRCTRESCDAEVAVRNLRTGRLETQLPVGSGAVTDLEILPSGAPAWIVSRSAERSVETGDAGRVRVLDRGPDIHTRSLARAGSRIYWTRGGEARTALLP